MYAALKILFYVLSFLMIRDSWMTEQIDTVRDTQNLGEVGIDTPFLLPTCTYVH